MSEITLITNISFVILDPGLRLEASALVIEPAGTSPSGRAMLRGFAGVADRPIFRLWLKDAEYTLVTTSNAMMVELTPSKTLQPSFFGAVMTIDKRRLFLQLEDREHNLQVTTFPIPESAYLGDEHKVWLEVYDRLWTALQHQVADFWTGSNIPYNRWVDVETYRSALRQTHVKNG